MITPTELKSIREQGNVELCWNEAKRVEQYIDRQLVILLGTGDNSGELKLKMPDVKIDPSVVALLVKGRYAESGWNVEVKAYGDGKAFAFFC